MDYLIYERLQEIEEAYYAGATFDALSEKIIATAMLIAGLDRQDPVREGVETFAPLLWGGASGSCIDPTLVKAALAGADGGAHLRSWSSIGRGLLAYRAAA